MGDQDVSELIKKLGPAVSRNRKYHLLREGFYRGALKYAFVRTFEFAEYAHALPDDNQTAFFAAGALRGICEDLIVLKFLNKLKRKDRDAAISSRMIYETSRAMIRQHEFFKGYRPFQPTVRFKKAKLRMYGAVAELKQLGHTSGFWNAKVALPNVESMARRTRLLRLYRFIYSMTSDLVHFNPRIAFRAGWGNVPVEVNFSTRNFSRYYLDFCRLYGALLFVLFFEKFRSVLKFTPDEKSLVESIKHRLDEELRWPEAVTYEEMNVKGPNELIRIFLRVAHEDRIAQRRKKKPATVGH